MFFRFKFKNGELYERFTYCVHREEDCYKMLIAKLADLGHCADGKTLVNLDCEGKLNVIRDNSSLLTAVENSRYYNGPSYDIPLEFHKSSGRSVNDDDGLIQFRIKDIEYCRRFSLKLNKEENAYKVLINKLDELGYNSYGKLLTCVENDGNRTIIEDCDSLWMLIEANGVGGPQTTLQLEFIKPEKTPEQNLSSNSTHEEDKISKLGQNIEKLVAIIEKLGKE